LAVVGLDEPAQQPGIERIILAAAGIQRLAVAGWLAGD
jgi:hypothetical protein